MATTIFMVFYPNGAFHSSITNETVAWNIADRIDGYVARLEGYKVLKEKDIPEPARTAIIKALEDPESRVTRERPKAA